MSPFMTVGELRERLANVDQSLPVGLFWEGGIGGYVEGLAFRDQETDDEQPQKTLVIVGDWGGYRSEFRKDEIIFDNMVTP